MVNLARFNTGVRDAEAVWDIACRRGGYHESYGTAEIRGVAFGSDRRIFPVVIGLFFLHHCQKLRRRPAFRCSLVSKIHRHLHPQMTVKSLLSLPSSFP